MLASQLASNSFRTHMSHTSNGPCVTEQQSASQRQGIHPTSVPATHPSRRSHHQSIKWSMHGSMGVMVRDLEWRGRHFLLFLWAIVTVLASALWMPSRCGSMLLRGRVFRAFVACLEQWKQLIPLHVYSFVIGLARYIVNVGPSSTTIRLPSILL